ncbi:membrane dipeptidase [Diplodia corticola]|uniref:Dipeptidase n=1 Tax=Diplodia corticola TaxID=236234 RepID=A0A1J9QRF0_9PEZI|nr:membrane dipeptidase [Diplodia corticola]OJD30993.1 membrane dipeptidase [Diplodia corticola]
MDMAQNATTLVELPAHETRRFSGFLPFILPAIIVVLFLSRKTPYNAPRVGKSRWWSLVPGQVPMRFEMDKWAERGYRKFHKALGKPFVTKVFGRDYLLMPPRYLDDVRKANEHNLNFAQCFSEAFNVHVSAGNVYSSNLMPDAVKQYLNPQLPSLVEAMNAECDHILSTELEAASEWKTVQAFPTFTAMAHRITCRILLGKELARNKDFVERSQSFNRSLFISAILINGVALGPLRSLIAWIAAVKHRADLARCTKHLMPKIEQTRSQMGEYDDAVKWMIELAGDDAVESKPQRLAHQLMHLMFAGSSAPGGLVVQMVYQILTSPEYVEPLRREMATTLEETGGFTASFLSRTPLLESFMRETMRLYPTGVVSVTRAVMDEPFRFHDGYTLPVGSRFAFPIHAIHRDPDNYDEPLTFRGFRFAGAAEGKQETNASTVDKSFLTFGYGRHACPGRFYAVRVAKLIFAKLLHEYDMEWDGPVTSRPANMCIEVQNGPNMDAKGPEHPAESVVAVTMEKTEQQHQRNVQLADGQRGRARGRATTVLAALLLTGLATVGGTWTRFSQRHDPVKQVLNAVPLIDGHNDFPIYIRAFYYNHIYGKNFSETADLVGQVDFPRLQQGGLRGQFWSAYVECPRDGGEVDDAATYYEALHQTLQQIDLIHRLVDAHPSQLQRASSAADVWAQFRHGQAQAISSLIGVEGLHQVANSASALRLFRTLGVRYVTLTHSCHNRFADSCSPPTPLHGGLSAAGRDAVREMNRLGLMVDLSHTSAATQRDALTVSRAPVVYTHSAAQALCDHPRNVADDELRALRDNGGVVMVNFSPGFVTCGPRATLADVADHVVYLGRLVGFRHVGIGADFDGMGFDPAPDGLEHVGTYPALIAELLRRGVSVEDVRGVAGANVLRVLADVERVAAEMGDEEPLEDRVKSMF